MRRCSSGGTARERAEDLARGAVVDVLARAEGVDERRVAREVGEDAQLDLAVVGGEEEVARLGHEGLADAPALRGADRDVLEVRVGRGEPAGGGDRLVEGGVDAAGLGVDERRQRVDVGGLELLDRAVLEDLPRAARGRAPAPRARPRRWRRRASWPSSSPRAGELLEEDLAELDRRVDVELARPARRSRGVSVASCASMSRLIAASRCGRRSSRRPAPCRRGRATSGSSSSS